MRISRRNSILLACYAATGVILTGTIVALMFLAFPDRPARPALLALGLAAFWVWFIRSGIAQRRELRNIERELRQAGVEVPDVDPIPVRLAENRESLVVGVIFLVLIAATFLAYFGGRIGRPA